MAAAKRRDARAVAELLLRSSHDIASGRGPQRARAARFRLPAVVIIPRPLFTDDARAIAAELGFERVLCLQRRDLKSLARTFLPPDTDHMSYRRVFARDPEAMLAYRSFLADVWRHFDPAGHVRLVLTGNFCYWSDVELGAALEGLDVPFVVMHKENLKSVWLAEQWATHYRDGRSPFYGRSILVHNGSERDLQVGQSIVAEDRIEVPGMARLDRFHAHRRRTAGETPDGDILFAGFLPTSGLPHPNGYVGTSEVLGLPLPDPEQRPEHLVEACLALHRVAVATARRMPDRRIVLKTKGREGDPVWFPRIVEHVAGLDGPPPNLDIVHGGDAARMTCEAALVVGLNTTVLLEAIAAGRPTAVLALGEAAGEMRDHVIDLSGAASVLDDEAEAIEHIVGLAEAPPAVALELPEAVRAVLERWTGNPDGRATERTVRALRKAMAAGERDPDGSTVAGSSG